MIYKSEDTNIKKSFSTNTVILICVGVLLNFTLSKVGKALVFPLYLDSIGTLISAILGGAIPGMIVGFGTNIVKTFSNPVSIYFGIISVAFALLATFFSRKGFFKSYAKCIIIVLCMASLGGFIGSCMTWLFYGGQNTNQVIEKMVEVLQEYGMGNFSATVCAGVVTDLIDKFISVYFVAVFLKHYPKKLYDKFPMSYYYDRSEEETDKINEEKRRYYRKSSIDHSISELIIITAVMVTIVSGTLNYVRYDREIKEQYEKRAKSVTLNVSKAIDGDRIEEYIKSEGQTVEYNVLEKKVRTIYECSEGIKYIFVYLLRDEGCQVVLDLNVGDSTQEKVGSIISYEAAFGKNYKEYVTNLKKEKDTNAILGKNKYGYLLSVYTPIKDSTGNTVAYVGADIEMREVIINELDIMVRAITLIFGITVIIVTFSIWFARKKIVAPIDTIVKQTMDFDRIGPIEWLDSDEWKNRIIIKSGDEFEKLYITVSNVQQNVAINLKKLQETEYKLQQSKEIEKKNKELAIAIKKADDANAAKSDFLSRMSHDLRTPLNGIIGITEIADMDLNNVEVTRHNFEDIKSAGEFMLELINDILDMAKIESGKIVLNKTTCDGEYFANAIKVMFERICKEKGIELVIDNSGNEIAVQADKMRLQQIIFNIFSNAVKFTPEGGSIQYTSTGELLDDDNVAVTLIIKDTGIGMSEEYQKHMYETFTQEEEGIRSATKGSGLGLPIAKSLVELMSGTIECKSRQNEGTEFRIKFVFPRAKDNKDSVVCAPKIDDSKFSGRRVLLCEDNPLNTKIVVKLLEKKHVITETCENGKAGIETFEKSRQGYYDFIFMDIRMPVMDGLEATRFIRNLDREDAKSIPIIAMTANAFDEDIKRSIEAGMTEHLAKPINPEILFTTMQKYL